MSVWVLSLPFLAFRPAVRRTSQRLIAATPKWLQILLLGAYRREVIADRTRRLLSIYVRRWWFMRHLTVRAYDRLEYLRYEFASLPTAGIPFSLLPVGGFGLRIADEVAWYDIAVQCTRDPKPLLLFRFLGEGSVTTGWGGTVLGDDLIDIEGDQEVRSRDYVRYLTQYLGVPIQTPMGHAVAEATAPLMERCPQCLRPLMNTAPRCVYCGLKFPDRDLST